MTQKVFFAQQCVDYLVALKHAYELLAARLTGLRGLAVLGSMQKGLPVGPREPHVLILTSSSRC
jgi:hypothetical protein